MRKSILKPFRYSLQVLAAIATFSTLSAAQEPVVLAKDQPSLLTSSDPQIAANKRLVFDYWREVLQARDISKATHYMTADFREHNPTVPSGLTGFLNYFKPIFTSPQPVKTTIDNLVDIVAERDIVILVLREELNDPKTTGQKYTTTWFDMFRVTDNKISEHWDYGTKK